MPQSCPLCGKTKPEKALFCNDCTKKIQTEYEIDIPAENGSKEIIVIEELSIQELPEDCIDDFSLPKVGGNDQYERNNQHGKKLSRFVDTEGRGQETEFEKTTPKKKKRIGAPWLLLLLIALLTGVFFVYNDTVHQGNLDHNAWEAAVRVNSIKGYLAYMEAHPRGVHFDEAQESLLRLKTEEAMVWERMKRTDKPTELRDFLHRYSGSPYTPLVKARLDSLIWAGALRLNTVESIFNYIQLAENGEIVGDYIGEARNRYGLLLSMPQPADTIVLDSIFETKSYPEVP